MKKRIGRRETFFGKIRSADPHAAMRFLAAALVFAVIAAALLFVASNRTNKQMAREMFCNVNTVLAEEVERRSQSTDTLSSDSVRRFLVTDVFDSKLGNVLYEVKSGNILYNSAREYGFTASHMGFLKTCRFPYGYSDTKLFSDIHDGKSGYAEVVTEKGRQSLSYTPVNNGEVYLVSVMPSEYLYSFENDYGAVFAILLVLLSALGTVFAVLSFRGSIRVKDEGADVRGKYRFLRKMLHQISDEDINIFVYTRFSDTLETLADDGKTVKVIGNAMEYITDGFDENNARIIRNAVALTGPDKDLSVTVEKDGVKYRYTFSYEKKSDGQPAVVCSAKRVYEKENVRATENSGRMSEDYKTTCIEVFLERNMWHFLWNSEECFDNTPLVSRMQNDYDSQFEKQIVPLIYKGDRENFVRNLNRLRLLECFREGRDGFVLEYRMENGSPELRDRTLEVRIYRDKNNDEIKANFYVRRMNKTI